MDESLFLLRQTERTVYFVQDARGRLWGLRRNPPLSEDARGRLWGLRRNPPLSEDASGTEKDWGELA